MCIRDSAIHHVDQLERYLSQNPASIEVLTVPRGVANQIAGRLVACGVKGIWNFTNIELNLNAPGVVVENVHFEMCIRDRDKPVRFRETVTRDHMVDQVLEMLR